MKQLIFTPLFTFIVIINSLNAQTTLAWQHTFGGSAHEYIWNTTPTSDGGYAFVGQSESSNGDVTGNSGGADFWVGKITSTGAVQWSYLFGGSDDDYGKDIIQTSDGGYLAVGFTRSTDGDVVGLHGIGSYDVWVLKLSSSGSLLWSKCFGGSGDDEGVAIVKNSTGEYYIGGTTYSTNGDVSGNHSNYSDFWVLKIDSTGNLLSQKCVGGTDSDEGICLIATSDNGCMIAGRTTSIDADATGNHGNADMLITKLSSSFVVEWSNCYGGSETEECNSVVQLTDGSYAALGYTSTHNNGQVTGHHGSQGMDDFWLLKLSSTGSLVWQKCIGGSGDDQANALVCTSDGGFALAGLTNSIDGDVSGLHGMFFSPDIWVCKTDNNGNVQWQRCCGGSEQDESFNMFQETGGALVVSGFTYSNDYDVTYNRGSADGWILKVTGGATGIEDTKKLSDVEIYPNPSSGVVYINSEDVLNIDIINIIGETVLSIENIYKNSIDLTNLERGMYIVRLSNKETFLEKKLVIN